MSNFALGAAAGGMAEGLDEILKRRFLEQIERNRVATEQARLMEDMRQADMQDATARRGQDITESYRQTQIEETNRARTEAEKDRDANRELVEEQRTQTWANSLPVGTRLSGVDGVRLAKANLNRLMKPATNSAGEPEFEFTGTQATVARDKAQTSLDESREGGGQERSPYFTHQTVFDAQGRPTGAIRFDARGGPPQWVDVSSLTGGGQLKPPPGQLGQMGVMNEAAGDALGNLEQMFHAGAKDLIGPAEGRARSVGQKIPGVPVNTKFAEFEAATSAFRNSVIKAITGAQMSEREADRIIKQIPEVNDKPEVWAAKAKQTRLNMQYIAERTKAQKPNIGGDAASRAAELLKKYGGGQ